MPQSLPMSAARVPYGSEANNAAQFMLDFGTDIDPHLVQWATSAADRDVKYGGNNAPLNTVVVSYNGKAMWLKVASSGADQWRTIYSDTGWVTTGFSYPTSGWEADSNASTVTKIRNRSGSIDLRLRATYTGSDLGSSDGALNDVTVATIPAAFVPDTVIGWTGALLGRSSAGLILNGTGAVRLVELFAGANLTAGTTLIVQATWLEP